MLKNKSASIFCMSVRVELQSMRRRMGFFDGAALNTATVGERLVARLRLRDPAGGRNIARDPYVAADGRAAPDADTPEDRRARINNHIILDDRMSRDSLNQRAVLAGRETLRAQRH